MKIYINGELKSVEGAANLRELLSEFKINPNTVVVELNQLVIARDKHREAPIKEGDKVEIVQFVGGGSEEAKKPRAAKAKAKVPSTKGPKNLVIVESPAKAKTINKYLGADYVVEASMGHVRDLPKSKMGIDIESGFSPQYIVMKKAQKTVKHLKKQAEGKVGIFLAPDPDREGEAISWHLAHIFSEQNGGALIQRVVFNEITKDAVKAAFEHPREIEMNLVNAQQARRILDRIVGYELSPLLWRKVGRGLSAGRVQSVALRLIVEREREIKSFVPVEYWSLIAKLSSEKPQNAGKIFAAKLDKIGTEKAQLTQREETEKIREEIAALPFKVDKVEVRERARRPQAPLTTSKLQQEAYNRLGFPAAKTMRLAQNLYEGVELGGEAVGLITYMRTDSVNLSTTAQQEAVKYLKARFGASYLPKEPPVYKSKKGAQEAHEAIRPTSATRDPDSVSAYLQPDELKLYDLIWRKFLASQMLPAIDEHMAVIISAGPKYFFKATGRRNMFAGFTAILAEAAAQAQAEAEKSKEEKPGEEADDEIPFGELPELVAGEILKMHELTGNQHFTKPPGRFNDASLVKILEEKGIGRPSTYAPTIYTLLTREYVERKGGALMPTELGETVTELLVKHFSNVLDVEFTARMEEELDKIEEGGTDWVKVLTEFYGPFQTDMTLAREEMKNVRQEAIPTDYKCDICGKGMVIKWGRFGRFMACSGFPECKYTRSIPTGFRCPNEGCGGDLVKRTSKNRRTFYGCSNYPQCTYIANKLPKEETVGSDEKISEIDRETLD